MDINWKEVAKSPGYISMKAAVADEAKRVAKWGRKPDSRYAESFRFAIGRAIHHACKRGVTLDVILNEWEEKRDYNFISFYSDHHLPKIHSNTRKPWGIRATIKEIRKNKFYRGEINGSVCSAIMRSDALKRKQRDNHLYFAIIHYNISYCLITYRF